MVTRKALDEPCQGRAPLPYALSELVDNALRATQANIRPRQITITLATSGGASPGAGLIAVWDNGLQSHLPPFGRFGTVHAAQQPGQRQQHPCYRHNCRPDLEKVPGRGTLHGVAFQRALSTCISGKGEGSTSTGRQPILECSEAIASNMAHNVPAQAAAWANAS